jgi:tetratricopeptide (TPR) repeat protein
VAQYPVRHENHNLEYQSELFLRNHLPIEWILDKPSDYGIDFKVEIVRNRAVIGQNFSVQLKAHQKAVKNISIYLERSTINLYLNRLEPILLICYIADNQEAYYTWFTERSIDLTRKNKGFSITFDATKKISTLNWDHITSYVNQIFSRKFLLHAFPEFNFSDMNIEEKTAASYYLNQDYETAAYLFKKLNNKNSNAFLLNSIALCEYALFHYDNALSAVNKALALADRSEIRLNKASILAEYGIASDNKAMLLEACQMFRIAVDEYGDANQHFNYANTLGALGEKAAAKDHYRKALKLNPNYAEAWKNLGTIYGSNKLYNKEIICYDKALAINPRLQQANISKGITLIKDYNNFKDGIICLEKAIEIDPDLFIKYTSGYYWLAFANFDIGNEEKGHEYLTMGLAQHPGDFYLLNLKRDYFEKNWRNNAENQNAAKEFMLYRLNLQPDDLVALECLIRIYLYEKATEEALQLLRKHTVLFQRSDWQELLNEGIHLESYLSALGSYPQYCRFRQLYPLVHLLNDLLTPSFYLELNEIIGLKLFHESRKYISAHKNEKNFERNLLKFQCEQVLLLYPETAPFVITEDVNNTTSFAEQMCNAIVDIPILVILEIGRINGYLSVNFGLTEGKMENAITLQKERKLNKAIFIACLDRIQERFHFFPED